MLQGILQLKQKNAINNLNKLKKIEKQQLKTQLKINIHQN